MIKIYCLVDPRTKRPFYVGATKYPLHIRLANHIGEARSWSKHPEMYQHGPTRQKQLTIILLLFIDMKPEIVELASVKVILADHYEKFFHDMFVRHKYKLYQKPTAFCYYKTYVNPTVRKRHTWMLRQYQKKYFKDFLIIIW